MLSRHLFAAAALTLGLAACAPQNQQPLAFEPVHPELDSTGTMQALAAQSGQETITLLQAITAQGVPPRLAKEALLKYDRFAYRVTNPAFLVMVDFTQHSSEKRFFMVNRASGKVDALEVAHGEGSDPKDDGTPKYFSNVPNSHMSSLGSYLIQERYFGSNGESIRLDGLERTNSNARDRFIVLHPAKYVKEGQRKQGMSWGCPAIPYAWIKTALQRLSGGAFMYIAGNNQHNNANDDYFIRQWNMIPKAQWVNEYEEAPQ